MAKTRTHLFCDILCRQNVFKTKTQTHQIDVGVSETGSQLRNGFDFGKVLRATDRNADSTFERIKDH